MGERFDPAVLKQAVEVVVGQVGLFDAGVVSGDNAVSLMSLFARVESAGASGKALCARRVELSNAHLRTGHRDAAGLVAAQTGVCPTEARSVLETARRLESLPSVDGAFRSGELSVAQVAEIARAGSVDPGVEHEMLELAKRDSLRALRKESRRVRVASSSEADEYEKAHNKPLFSRQESRSVLSRAVWAVYNS